MPQDAERDQRAMEMIVKSGMFAREFGMRELVQVSRELQVLGNDGDLAAWTLISKDYVYTGNIAQKLDQIVTR